MTEHEKHRLEYFARIRRVKRWLRPLPRKANIHRYPVLKWFASTARKRAYLWSFRAQEVVPALYAGWILTLMPFYGAQIALGFLLALVFRANLMVLIGLQFFSNPLTVGPIYWFCYTVGHFFLSLFVAAPAGADMVPMVDEEVTYGLFETMRQILGNNLGRSPGEVARMVVHFFSSAMLGATILGFFAGFISSIAYRLAARGAAIEYARLKNRAAEYVLNPPQKTIERKNRKTHPPHPSH